MATQPSQSRTRPSKPSPATLGLTITGTTLLSLFSLTLPFLRTYTGAPYVASTTAAQRAIRSFLTTHTPPHRKPRLIDLGSGSGEHVVTAARCGYSALGVELNPWLVLYSRLRALGLREARFQRQDLWHVDVGEFDVVVVFGVPGMMQRVKSKLEKECGEGCVVASHVFDIPGWREKWREGGVRFYRVGEQKIVRGVCDDNDAIEN